MCVCLLFYFNFLNDALLKWTTPNGLGRANVFVWMSSIWCKNCLRAYSCKVMVAWQCWYYIVEHIHAWWSYFTYWRLSSYFDPLVLFLRLSDVMVVESFAALIDFFYFWQCTISLHLIIYSPPLPQWNRSPNAPFYSDCSFQFVCIPNWHLIPYAQYIYIYKE